MIRFLYSISYIPGTTLSTADTLSYCSLRNVSSSVPDICAFVAATVAAMPLCDVIIDVICAATITDTTLRQVLRHCQAGWPDVKNLSPDELQFAHSRDHLTKCDDLVMNDARIVISFALYEKMLEASHNAHQGIVKMQKRARTSLWWPNSVKILSELHLRVSRVRTGVQILLSRCCHHRCPTYLGRRWQQTYLNMIGSIASLSWITFHAL